MKVLWIGVYVSGRCTAAIPVITDLDTAPVDVVKTVMEDLGDEFNQENGDTLEFDGPFSLEVGPEDEVNGCSFLGFV